MVSIWINFKTWFVNFFFAAWSRTDGRRRWKNQTINSKLLVRMRFEEKCEKRRHYGRSVRRCSISFDKCMCVCVSGRDFLFLFLSHCFAVQIAILFLLFALSWLVFTLSKFNTFETHTQRSKTNECLLISHEAADFTTKLW